MDPLIPLTFVWIIILIVRVSKLEKRIAELERTDSEG
jgi:hypothetical protein